MLYIAFCCVRLLTIACVSLLNACFNSVVFMHIFAGVNPKIEKHPQDQCAVLGGRVTFRCKASTSGLKITYKWLHTRGGRDSEVNQRGKPASAELTITEVTEEHRGKYKCIVKNEFGEEKSQSAELMVGM